MKIPLMILSVTAVAVAMANSAQAANQLNGSFGTFNLTGSSYSGSSLTLAANNYVNGSIGGDFLGLLPQYSLISTYSSTLTGIGSTLTPENIDNFFQIASAATPITGYHGAGTPTPNQFDFQLTGLVEPVAGTFYGYGTLVDTTGQFAASPASFTVGFAGSSSYSFTFAAVPEPGIYGVSTAALALLPVSVAILRRRRQG